MGSDRGFRFAYDPPVIRFGSGSVGDLGSELRGLGSEGDDFGSEGDDSGHTRALVVTGRTTGEASEVMDPLRRGLGDRLSGVFAETTAEKRLGTAVRCADRLRESEATVLVAVGGGSAIDLARVASVVAGSDHSPEELGSQLAATGTLPVPEDLTPVVAVPTTLAGAGLSMLAGVTADPASGLVAAPAGGGVGDPRLMAALTVYDPQLVAETPRAVLAGSAFNGFNKGIEALYASTRTPITDATASRGVGLLAEGLPALRSPPDAEDLDPVVRGVILAGYGTSRPNGTSFSVLHAIGHALRVHADVQLGVAHAAVAPDALAWVFEAVDGRRRLLAEALGAIDDADAAGSDPGDAVVAVIEEVRESLGLPARLRDVDGVDPDILDDVAGTAAEGFIGANDAPDTDRDPREPRETAHGWSGTPHPPPGMTVPKPAVRGILESAW